MKFATKSIAACVVLAWLSTSFNAQAQSEQASGVSVLSTVLASVVVGEGAASAARLPLTMSRAGAELSVKAVQSTARGTVYVLQNASDGVQASVEMLHGGARAASHAVGTVLVVSVIGAGVLLTAAGEVVAFIPNAVGRALLHNERVTP